MSVDPTSQPLGHPLASADVAVEHHTYLGDLAFDLYRPAGPGPHPVVVLVTGLPDPGVVQFFGKPLKDWAGYAGWARALAASGLAAVTYVNRSPADVTALIDHLRGHAAELGLDPARLGVWSSSGNVPTALGVLARAPVRAAALLYGYMLDLGGATRVADAAKRFYFAIPPIGLADLPRGVPILVVRADQDATPGLNDSLDELVAAAGELDITVQRFDGPHAFELVADTPATHAAVDAILGFLRTALRA